MAWIPIVVSNKKGCHRSNNLFVTVGLLISLVFGIVFFSLFNSLGIFRFNFPGIFIILGFAVFIMVILGVSFAASSMSKAYKPPKANIYGKNQNINQRQASQQNPYFVGEPIRKHLVSQYQENPTDVFPIVNEINFCRYCGAKIDREARFCHQCGSKL
ncbi:hypothetical protein LCGC14_0604000 [marine sediment metagenome]|uniref:Zinc-ribbon domain-containing protein n=1 Tax=marine sediment metagenome TaxID=412755 RepID=A0A0F9TVV4_9ZZZZ